MKLSTLLSAATLFVTQNLFAVTTTDLCSPIDVEIHEGFSLDMFSPYGWDSQKNCKSNCNQIVQVEEIEKEIERVKTQLLDLRCKQRRIYDALAKSMTIQVQYKQSYQKNGNLIWTKVSDDILSKITEIILEVVPEAKTVTKDEQQFGANLNFEGFLDSIKRKTLIDRLSQVHDDNTKQIELYVLIPGEKGLTVDGQYHAYDVFSQQ